MGKLLAEIEKPRKRLHRFWQGSVVVYVVAISFGFVFYLLRLTSFQLSLELNIIASLIEAIVSSGVLAAWVLPPVLRALRQNSSTASQ